MKRKYYYDQRWDGPIVWIIKDGEFEKTKQFGVRVVEPPGKAGDCQSWAFEKLGIPQFKHGKLSKENLSEAGFIEVNEAKKGDLAIYYLGTSMDHFGIYHGDNRIISKLGVEGAVCIHPFPAFAGISSIKFYHRNQ